MPPAVAPPPDRNPYAPPAAELRIATAEQCWRDGKHLVLRRGGDLPPRCLHCNAPGLPSARARAFSWHSPWLYLLAPVNLLLYAVIALLARKTVKLHPALCAAHRRAQRRYWLLCAGLMASGLGLLYAATPGEGRSGPLATDALLLSPFLLLLAIVIAAWKLGELTTTRIDADCVRLRGAGKAFLDSLPPWDGMPPTGMPPTGH